MLFLATCYHKHDDIDLVRWRWHRWSTESAQLKSLSAFNCLSSATYAWRRSAPPAASGGVAGSASPIWAERWWLSGRSGPADQARALSAPPAARRMAGRGRPARPRVPTAGSPGAPDAATTPARPASPPAVARALWTPPAPPPSRQAAAAATTRPRGQSGQPPAAPQSRLYRQRSAERREMADRRSDIVLGYKSSSRRQPPETNHSATDEAHEQPPRQFWKTLIFIFSIQSFIRSNFKPCAIQLYIGMTSQNIERVNNLPVHNTYYSLGLNTSL